MNTTIVKSHSFSAKFCGIYERFKMAWYIGWKLTTRNLKAQYRRAFFGYFWVLVPVFSTAAFLGVLKETNAINVDTGDIPYPVFVALGTTLWQLFVSGFNIPRGLVSSNKGLLKKVNFPKESLLYSAVMQVMFGFFIKFIFVFPVSLYYSDVLTVSLLWVPLLLLSTLILGATMGVFIAPFVILFQDISASVSYFLKFAFIATPVVYPAPKEWPYTILVDYNPVSSLILTLRDIIFHGKSLFFQEAMIIAIISSLLFYIGWKFLKMSIPIILERI